MLINLICFWPPNVFEDRKKKTNIHDLRLKEKKKKNTIYDTLRWLPIYVKTFLVYEICYTFYAF